VRKGTKTSTTPTRSQPGTASGTSDRWWVRVRTRVAADVTVAQPTKTNSRARVTKGTEMTTGSSAARRMTGSTKGVMTTGPMNASQLTAAIQVTTRVWSPRRSGRRAARSPSPAAATMAASSNRSGSGVVAAKVARRVATPATQAAWS
jgi:hypothetical protein